MEITQFVWKRCLVVKSFLRNYIDLAFFSVGSMLISHFFSDYLIFVSIQLFYEKHLFSVVSVPRLKRTLNSLKLLFLSPTPKVWSDLQQINSLLTRKLPMTAVTSEHRDLRLWSVYLQPRSDDSVSIHCHRTEYIYGLWQSAGKFSALSDIRSTGHYQLGPKWLRRNHGNTCTKTWRESSRCL